MQKHLSFNKYYMETKNPDPLFWLPPVNKAVSSNSASLGSTQIFILCIISTENSILFLGGISQIISGIKFCHVIQKLFSIFGDMFTFYMNKTHWNHLSFTEKWQIASLGQVTLGLEPNILMIFWKLWDNRKGMEHDTFSLSIPGILVYS